MNSRSIDVCLSPLLLPHIELTKKVAVVIDVLRASSTICVALANGAKAVIPVETIEECQKFEGPDHVLAAERHGLKVEGFDFGNSPYEYMNGAVEGKILVLTTTNGTRAIRQSKEADSILVGSFLNLDPICEYLSEQANSVVLVCAGWRNRYSLEDSLFAGAVLNQLSSDFDMESDAALATVSLYDTHKNNLMGVLKQASHYKRLAKLGISKEVEYCLSPNQVSLIPVFQYNKLIAL